MSRVDVRDVRAMLHPDDSSPRSPRSTRKLDYSALLATRRTVVRPVPDAPPASRQQDDPSNEPDPSSRRTDDFPLISNEHEPPSSHAELTPAELAECRVIATRIANAAAPIASATLQERRNHLGLLSALSREIAEFCSDPAVAAGGQWEAHVVLNDRVLASTELHVSLSYFELQLRFDTQNSEARQLLLAHSIALERELDSMLRAWGQLRTVRFTVW
ncbi:type III secretion system protein SctP [Burkholderia metallica]|uniref:type III secretion system protein SctP n=1 Tax=Burkholderia metallica TaxID=488729 RepID=UPI001CF3B921|nr:type III secretion system protein SctP [Burkholderia metallica]MCA8023430.1 type III secretion system protein SctP [Burkholderia metallica]